MLTALLSLLKPGSYKNVSKLFMHFFSVLWFINMGKMHTGGLFVCLMLFLPILETKSQYIANSGYENSINILPTLETIRQYIANFRDRLSIYCQSGCQLLR